MTLQEFKESKGLSYRGLASLLGYNHDRVWLYCKGQRKPNIDAVLHIEEVTKGEVSVKDWKSKN